MVVSLRENVMATFRLPRNESLLRGRAQLLEPDDRIIIEAVVIEGRSAESVARLQGVPSRRVRTRVRRLTQRLTSRRFLDAARSLPYLSPDDAHLARLSFCHGLSQRDICRRLGISSHGLRRRLDRIAGQVQTLRRHRRAGGQWPADAPASEGT